MAFFNSPIRTAAELIRSEVVLDEAVKLLRERLPANQCPDAQQIGASLVAEPIKETDILVVRFTDSNPLVAKMVLQGILDGFLKLNSTQSAGSASESRRFLEDQLRLAYPRMREARDRLRQFQIEHEAPDLPVQVSSLLTQVS